MHVLFLFCQSVILSVCPTFCPLSNLISFHLIFTLLCENVCSYKISVKFENEPDCMKQSEVIHNFCFWFFCTPVWDIQHVVINTKSTQNLNVLFCLLSNSYSSHWIFTKLAQNVNMCNILATYDYEWNRIRNVWVMALDLVIRYFNFDNPSRQKNKKM